MSRSLFESIYLTVCDIATQFVNSGMGRRAAHGAIGLVVEKNVRPWLRKHSQDMLFQSDPRSGAWQIDHVGLHTGHNTFRHMPPQAVNAEPVNLQNAGALWEDLMMADQMNRAANAAQAAADAQQQNQNQ